MPPAEGVIDHDRLWVEYQRSLVDTLRGFSSGVEGLSAFVPHEDPRISLRNLLDAAAAAGRRTLSVRFGRAAVQAEELRALAAGYGHVRLLATDDELVLVVDELHPAAVTVVRPAVAAPQAHPVAAASRAEAIDVYAAALAAVTTFAHAGPPVAGVGQIVVETTIDGATLHLHVDPAHVIAGAGFAGGDPALLETFCTVITGLPLLEAAHHGVIRTEAALRPPGQRPVPGIVTPRAAHPRFSLPEALIRAALASYRARTGYDERVNRHDRGPGPTWRVLTASERAARVKGALDRLELQGLTLVAVEHDVRLVFAVADDVPPARRPRLLLELEGHLQREIDPRLEVYGEERADRNKLRRLAGKSESR